MLRRAVTTGLTTRRFAGTIGVVADPFRLQLLLATFAGGVNPHQSQVIDYLIEENRVLEEQLGKRRLRLTDDQRRRLAAKGQTLGHRVLARIATIVTPDTIMRRQSRKTSRSRPRTPPSQRK